MSDMNKQAQVKARKKHICELCRRPILPGDEYIRQTWTDCGWHTAARHIHCDAVLDGVMRLSGAWNEEYSPEEIREDVRMYVCELCEYYGDCQKDPYACEIVLANLVNPAWLHAAHESARRCEERAGR